ncbi:hypothetical protein PENSPDRAFT_736045, partial [Peniophora sp. CONT]
MSCPIVRLQSDLLVQVFNLLATFDPPVRALHDQPGHLGWITASHVCQKWRYVLLRMPLLWAKVVGAFPYPSACTTIFERCGEAPLTSWPSDDIKRGMMHGEYDGIGISKASSELALQHLSRVEAFGWQISPESNLKENFAQFAIGDLSRMRHLSIYGFKASELVEAEALSAPILETLFLRNVSFLVHAPSLRALHLHYTDDAKPPLTTFAILVELPLLEELDLVGAIQEDCAHSADIELPRLASLQYSGKWAQFLTLWSSITIKPAANIELELIDHVEDVFIPMRAHLSREEHDSLRLSYDGDAKEFDLQVFSSATGSTFVTASGRTVRSGIFVRLLDYRKGYGHGEVEPNFLVSALVASIIPTNIRSVDLDLIFTMNHHVCEAGPLRNAFIPLTNVETVVVGRDTSVMHLFVLFVNMSGFRLQDPVFPNLKTLFFKDMLDTVPYAPVKGRDAAGLMLNNWIYLSVGIRNLSALGCHLPRVVMTKYSKEELGNDSKMIEYQDMQIREADFSLPHPRRQPTQVEGVEPRSF